MHVHAYGLIMFVIGAVTATAICYRLWHPNANFPNDNE